MISLPPHVRVHVALGYTDLRKGIDGLSVLVQETLRADPFSGHVFVFRGRKAGLIKLLYHDGNGMCLYAKRLDQGIFTWPVTQASPGEPATVLLTPARLSMLLEGLDWRAQAPARRLLMAG
ncbi:transposase [Gluconobacter thailandicus]|uniref:IS66 family insertion sequence element accessory protein TnpB n=1 Tax=Gluconobacter thailandicus TaxID=257438 RepID=UPI000776C477|nr:IS66 family insertion sequence element accessory protein TnpB [Gluconobacter thailandicus]KXV34690.1 transposase [Gluconobacter thailandicus]